MGELGPRPVRQPNPPRFPALQGSSISMSPSTVYSTPTLNRSRAQPARVTPSSHPVRFTRPDSIRNLAIASALMGVGAAIIDTTYSIPDHNVAYYYGWGLLAVAFGIVVWTFAEDVIDPTWAYLGMVALGVYGWWNITWWFFMANAGRTIDGVHGKVILANLGVLWPYSHGLVEVSLAAFVVSTVIAVTLPLVTYMAIRFRQA